jgi:hypothetical protein
MQSAVTLWVKNSVLGENILVSSINVYSNVYSTQAVVRLALGQRFI